MSRLYSIEQKDTEKKLDSVKEEKIMPNVDKDTVKEVASVKGKISNSYMTIEAKVMKAAIKEHKIKPIEIPGRTEDAVNKYYEYTDIGLNVVLMHVSKGRYIIFDRYVYCKKTSKVIDVVMILKDLCFCSAHNGHNRDRTKCILPIRFQKILGIRTASIERIIYGIIENGEIGKLKDNYIVHHKDNVFDDRLGMTMYIDAELHTNNKSHLLKYATFYIEDMKEFNDACTKMRDNYKKLKDVDNAA